MTSRIDLTGMTAVITGGGQGLGLAAARRLMSSGAQVCLWDFNKAALDSGLRDLLSEATDTHGVHVDITDANAVADAVAETVDHFGHIDILVNNAGITGPNTSTWTYPVDAWRSVVEVCLTGTFLCSRAIVPGMIERKYGRIVNIASVAGKEGNPNAAAYSAAKAGVIGLTKSLGKELAGTGVLCNCITPAAIETAIFSQMTEAHIAYMLSKIPMGRFGQTDELAAMVAWLASQECSFSTGAVFDLSGGRATY